MAGVSDPRRVRHGRTDLRLGSTVHLSQPAHLRWRGSEDRRCALQRRTWQRPAEALVRRDAGEIELAPPTWVTLYELGRHSTVEAALAATRVREPERFETHIAVEQDGPTAMWHGDAGWADGNANADGPRHRLRMHTGSWHYERTDPA